MKSKTLAIIGIVAYILSVLSSAKDLEGNSKAPIILIIVTAILMIFYMVMAIIRLWKNHKLSIILFISSFLISLVYFTIPIKIINFGLYMWVVSLLWTIGNREVLSNNFQSRNLQKIKDITGIDIKNVIPIIGHEIKWSSIVNHIFRVLEFDRCGTTINDDNKLKAKTLTDPFGYLLVESPIFSVRVKIPIVNKTDFLLAAEFYDTPCLSEFIDTGEFLVTYAPKNPKGSLVSMHHVLHYVFVPMGTLDKYYSMNNDIHYSMPDPKLLFGTFNYTNEISVNYNDSPSI